jgi:hypothetical protein
MLRSLLVAAVAAAAIAGCGGQSDEERVRAALHDYFSAFAAGDADAVCGLMTPASRDAIGGSDCAEFLQAGMDKAAKGAPTITKAEIDLLPVTVSGDRATIGDEGEEDPLELRKVGEDWLVDQR